MTGPIAYLRRLIDREWIKVDWAGSPTLGHRLIALAPSAILLIPVTLVERFSYEWGIAILSVGFALSAGIYFWILQRQLAGIGSFSTSRSDRVVKRSRRKARKDDTPPIEPGE
ncbi:hypothetical protein [Alteriqipengyuania lutimaris]|uniref:hypothetical protein n=1 Tax=Alteriqipengyuania lutimaris TaxID=1538146 RepID=UPI0011C04736|nr:hypothetical protein [Alteriqipengyuania lutimaris]MBB3032587.1 hypothetical protein [Alteriqipengyuania lutimaris]